MRAEEVLNLKADLQLQERLLTFLKLLGTYPFLLETFQVSGFGIPISPVL